MRNTIVLGAALLAATSLASGADRVADVDPAAAARLIRTELAEGKAFEILQHLTDRIGPRLSGSAGAAAAVRWTKERLAADGLVARTEPVMVPRWVRGVEEADIVAPNEQRLAITALGGSVGTPEQGITAEVVETRSLEDLESLGADRVRGRIVLFNRVMRGPLGPDGYRAVSPLRVKGPSAAERLGAVATLVRSLGTLEARLPHTGSVSTTDPPGIPAAAISGEDADLLHRLLATGPARVRLRLGCRTLPDVESANVIADLPGRERPEEIVLIGAHLDSWDLGTGALDDGAGVAMVMESLRLLRALGLTPRRTIRGVLYMNEENGLAGGNAYAATHSAELDRHVAAIESDTGAARPLGFTLIGGSGAADALRALAPLFAALDLPPLLDGDSAGADIAPLRDQGVPVLGLRQDLTHYFDWHHTAGDTLDKVDPVELARNAAAMAVMAYALAETPQALPRPAPLAPPTPSPTPPSK